MNGLPSFHVQMLVAFCCCLTFFLVKNTKKICMQVGEECGDGGWAPYYPNREAKDLWDLWEKNRDDPPPFSTKYEICEDILINENGSADKLTYYNRIIAAQPIDSKEKYKITPTKGIDYTAPPKYDYSEYVRSLEAWCGFQLSPSCCFKFAGTPGSLSSLCMEAWLIGESDFF